MAWRCLASALSLSWLSACIPIAFPIPPEHQSKLDDLEFLKVHATKKAEVIQRLGAPAFDAGRFLIYDDYSERWGYGLIILSSAGGGGGSHQTSYHYHVICAFDENGVLADYEITREDKDERGSLRSTVNRPSDQSDGMLQPGRAPNLIDTKHFPSRDWSVTLSPSGEFAALSVHRYLYDDQTANFQHLDTQLLMNLKLATTLPISETGDVEFSHDGRTAAVLGNERRVGPNQPSPDEVRLLDTGTGATRVNFLGHGNKASSSGTGPVVRSVAFSQDGRLVASGASDGTVMIWDAENGRERSMLKASANGVAALAFSPDGKTLATTAISDDGMQETVKVWDVRGGVLVIESDDAGLVQQDALKMTWQKSQALLAYSPDGTLLAINRGRIVEVFQLFSAGGTTETIDQARNTISGITHAKVSNVFLPDHDTVLSHISVEGWRLTVAFSPDRTRLTANSATGAIVWDLASSRELWRVNGSIEDVALSADGTRLYAASGTAISVYDVGS